MDIVSESKCHFNTGEAALNHSANNEGVDLEDLIADLDQLQCSLSRKKFMEDTAKHELNQRNDYSYQNEAEFSTSEQNQKCETNIFKEIQKGDVEDKSNDRMEFTIPIFCESGEEIGTVAVNKTTTTSEVCRRVEIMQRLEYDVNHVIIEQLSDLGIGRVLEDHDIVSKVFARWAVNANNKFIFTSCVKKYDFFQNTSDYFPAHMLDSEEFDKAVTERAARKKRTLLEKMFSSCSTVPSLEGYLHAKDFSKRTWSKRFFILRGSGLYFAAKKGSKSKASSELECSINFEDSDIYTCLLDPVNFKRKHKSPTENCFCLVPHKARKLKDIKCICSDDTKTLNSWITAIRIAKHGHMLRENYDRAMRRKETLRRQQLRKSSHVER